MGIDWWVNNPCFTPKETRGSITDTPDRIEQRLNKLENSPNRQ